jgi:hypothetical protein
VVLAIDLGTSELFGGNKRPPASAEGLRVGVKPVPTR